MASPQFTIYGSANRRPPLGSQQFLYHAVVPSTSVDFVRTAGHDFLGLIAYRFLCLQLQGGSYGLGAFLRFSPLTSFLAGKRPSDVSFAGKTV